MPTTGTADVLTGTAGVPPARSRAARTFLLVFILCISHVSSGFSQDVVTSLTNDDILTMVKAKLPTQLIIEKINNSACAFDTFPSVLAELKYRGVPDEVLMAMVKAPRGAPRKQSEPGAVATGSLVSTVSTSSAATTGQSERRGEQSVPGAIATGSYSSPRVTNIGGMILHDRSESPYNARFFVTPMDEGFDGLISALMLEKKLPLRVVADESVADFIIVGGTNKGPHKWYDTVFTGYERDRNQGSIRVIRLRDKTVIWAAQKGDRSLWWGPLKKGGRRKVAERLVNKMKGDLFKDNF